MQIWWLLTLASLALSPTLAENCFGEQCEEDAQDWDGMWMIKNWWVPCEKTSLVGKPNDINHHQYRYNITKHGWYRPFQIGD